MRAVKRWDNGREWRQKSRNYARVCDGRRVQYSGIQARYVKVGNSRRERGGSRYVVVMVCVVLDSGTVKSRGAVVRSLRCSGVARAQRLERCQNVEKRVAACREC